MVNTFPCLGVPLPLDVLLGCRAFVVSENQFHIQFNSLDFPLYTYNPTTRKIICIIIDNKILQFLTI